jgi:hypothetical protein
MLVFGTHGTSTLIYVGGRARRGPGMRHPEGDLPFLLPPFCSPATVTYSVMPLISSMIVIKPRNNSRIPQRRIYFRVPQG